MEADVELTRLYGGFRVCVCVSVAGFVLQASLENENTSHHTELSPWETRESNRIQKPT